MNAYFAFSLSSHKFGTANWIQIGKVYISTFYLHGSYPPRFFYKSGRLFSGSLPPCI